MIVTYKTDPSLPGNINI